MKGSYLLLLELGKDKEIEVGRLGKVHFKKGFYCYVGSGMGRAASIENRTSRHKRLNKEKAGKLKWHIDYLLVDMDIKIADVVTIESEKRLECELSEKMSRLSEGQVKNFGSSDCNCESHLYFFRKRPNHIRATCAHI